MLYRTLLLLARMLGAGVAYPLEFLNRRTTLAAFAVAVIAIRIAWMKLSHEVLP
jgi:hypothetical protein